MAVEQLSELLEEEIKPNKIAELKQRVVDKSIYVKHRREILLEDTAQGLKGKLYIYIWIYEYILSYNFHIFNNEY